jgi:hypothetical protein
MNLNISFADGTNISMIHTMIKNNVIGNANELLNTDTVGVAVAVALYFVPVLIVRYVSVVLLLVNVVVIVVDVIVGLYDIDVTVGE